MAKTQIRNEQELQNLLTDAIYNAVDYTMEKIYEENADLIDKYVYDAYTPQLYMRTGQFRNAWRYLTKRTSGLHIGQVGGGVLGKMYYAPELMDYVPEEAQHGTPSRESILTMNYNEDTWNELVSNWGDARDYLADILYNGNTGPLFGDGDWRKKRDAWTPLIKKLDTKIFKWFEDGMRLQGLKVYKR